MAWFRNNLFDVAARKSFLEARGGWEHPPNLKLELSVASVAEGLPSLSTILGFTYQNISVIISTVVRGIWPASRT